MRDDKVNKTDKEQENAEAEALAESADGRDAEKESSEPLSADAAEETPEEAPGSVTGGGIRGAAAREGG